MEKIIFLHLVTNEGSCCFFEFWKFVVSITEKRKTSYEWIFVVSMIRRGKFSPYRLGMTRLKLFDSRTSSGKSFFRNCSQQQYFASSICHHTQALVRILANCCLGSELSAQPLSKLNNLPSIHEATFHYNSTQNSPFDLQSWQFI